MSSNSNKEYMTYIWHIWQLINSTTFVFLKHFDLTTSNEDSKYNFQQQKQNKPAKQHLTYNILLQDNT